MKSIEERLVDELELNPVKARQVVRMFLQYTPSPVDVSGKFEADGGIHVEFGRGKTKDDAMLRFVAEYCEDNGYNKYQKELLQRLAGIPGPIDKSFSVRDHKSTNN